MAGAGMEMFTDLRQGMVGEVIGQQNQQGIANEGEVGEEMGVAAAGAVLAHEGVAAPVIADFDAAPVAANEAEPLFRGVLTGWLAGKIVVGFGGGEPGFFNGALVAQNDQGPGEREVGGEGFDGEGVEAAGFDASATRLGVDKKGVSLRRSRFLAWRNSLGWLPLIWSR
jgi:hypothetical protein